MNKRLASLLVLLAAAVLVLWPRLSADPDGRLGTLAKSGPLYFVGAGNSLQLVRGGFPSAKRARRGLRRQAVDAPPLPGTLDLRDGLASPSGTALVSGAAESRQTPAGELRSVRRGPDGVARTGSPAGKAFGSRIAPRSRPLPPAARGPGTEQSGNATGQETQARTARSALATGAVAGGGAALPKPIVGRDFDGRRPGGWRSSSGSAAPVASWSPKERGKPSPAKKPPVAPTLSDWIGKGPLKPPTGKPQPPSFAPLKPLFPDRLPDGRAYQRATPLPGVLELVAPPEERPDYAAWLEKDQGRGRKAEPHWHMDGTTWLLHAGKAWGIAEGGGWSWMLASERRWWTVADGAQRMLRHGGAWWWRTSDGWFLLKGGEPWAWRHFEDWQGYGFIHPTRGTQVVYSADGARVAVLTPGRETVVFDAVSGEALAHFPAKAGSLMEEFHGKPE